MHKTILCVLRRKIPLVLLFAVFLGGCAEKEVVNRDSKGKNIICFGDSITFGYGVEKGEDYPSRLREMLKLPVINAGVDGDTSAKALLRLKADVLDKEPYLVIIEFGGNDFLEKITIGETAGNMAEMIKQIQAGGAMAAVVDISTQFVMADLGRELRRLSDVHRAVFVPHVFDNILTNPCRKSDFIHPNAEGYKIVANRVLAAIALYLPPESVVSGLPQSPGGVELPVLPPV
ncbi:MAG: GDSL-type esterase/lipase family protein, partial [Candidatus Omnitrophica bacterium]|nr:GDSL-type esterase/lipase family protein [Candidatus Omnitrophota bacterium]